MDLSAKPFKSAILEEPLPDQSEEFSGLFYGYHDRGREATMLLAMITCTSKIVLVEHYPRSRRLGMLTDRLIIFIGMALDNY
jgi:hypothetical protein